MHLLCWPTRGRSSYRKAPNFPAAPVSPPAPWLPVNWDGSPRASKQAGPTGWRWRRPWRGGEEQGWSRWERGYIQAMGSHPSPTYLFIFRRFLGGVATGAGRKGREGGERGREGCGLWAKLLRRAGGDRRAGARLCWASPARRVGDPAKSGVAMQRKARVARASREREGRGGSGFCPTRAPRVARPGRCPGRGAESALRGPVQPPALCRVSWPPCHRRPGLGGQGRRQIPRLHTQGYGFARRGTPVLRGFLGLREVPLRPSHRCQASLGPEESGVSEVSVVRWCNTSVRSSSCSWLSSLRRPFLK